MPHSSALKRNLLTTLQPDEQVWRDIKERLAKQFPSDNF